MSLANGDTDAVARQSKATINKWQLVPTLLLHFRHFMQIVKLFQLCHIAQVNQF